MAIVNSAHTDFSGNRSITGVIGTLGTADVGGTALTLPIGIAPADGGMYTHMLDGTTAVTAGTIMGTWQELTGSATAGTTDIIVSTDISNYRWMSLQLFNTFVGTVNVQVSNDNSTFVNAALLVNNTAATNTASTVFNTTGIWHGPISARYARIRMMAYTSGTAQAVVELNSLPSVLHSMGVSAVQNGAWNVTGTVATGTLQNLVTGTLNTVGQVNGLASGTLNVGTVAVNAGTVMGTFQEFNGTVTAGTTDILASTDLSNYKWISAQIINTWVGTINIQASNDNSTFISQAVISATSQNNSGVQNITANGVYHGPIIARYYRVRMNAFTSGTAVGIIEAYSLPGVMQTFGVNSVMTTGTLTTGTLAALAAGTITAGTLTNLATGTINALASGTITAGTLTNLATGTINALASGTITAGTIAVTAGTIMGTWQELTGSATAGTVDIVASTDINNYRWMSLQLFNTFVGTVNVQVSNDNVNFINAAVLINNVTTTGIPSTNFAQTGIWHGPISARYARVRMMAFTSGTAQGVLELYSIPTVMHNFGVSAAQSGAWNVTGTMATGTLQNLATGTINALASGTITAGTVQVGPYTYSNFAAAGTTTIKSGTGVLHTFTVNTKSVGGSGTLYESAGTSAVIIAAIDTTLAQDTLTYDAQFGSLTFAWAGNTGGNVTVTWR